MRTKGTKGTNGTKRNGRRALFTKGTKGEYVVHERTNGMKGEYVANEETKGTERNRKEGSKEGRKEGMILQVHELFQFDHSGSYKSIKSLAYASAVILLGAFPANLGNGNRGY